MTNKIISDLCKTAAAVKAVVLFNNPEAATYTAYQVGDALGYIFEGWRIGEINGDFIKLVLDGQPDRVIKMDGMVRVRHEAGWRLSRKEVSVCAIGVGSTTLIVGNTFPVKEVFKFYGAQFIKSMPIKEFGGEPVAAWSFLGALPDDVKDLLHAPRPGVWQCVVTLLQGSPIWLEGDHHNLVGMVSGFCTRSGNREFAEALGTNKVASMRKLMAHTELWETFIPSPAEVEEAVQPVIEVVVDTTEEKPAKKVRKSRSKANVAKKSAVIALEHMVKGDLVAAARAFGIHKDEDAGGIMSDEAEMAMLLKMESLLGSGDLQGYVIFC